MEKYSKSTYLNNALLLYFKKVHVEESWSWHQSVIDLWIPVMTPKCGRFLLLPACWSLDYQFTILQFKAEWVIYWETKILSCSQNEVISIQQKEEMKSNISIYKINSNGAFTQNMYFNISTSHISDHIVKHSFMLSKYNK